MRHHHRRDSDDLHASMSLVKFVTSTVVARPVVGAADFDGVLLGTDVGFMLGMVDGAGVISVGN